MGYEESSSPGCLIAASRESSSPTILPDPVSAHVPFEEMMSDPTECLTAMLNSDAAMSPYLT